MDTDSWPELPRGLALAQSAFDLVQQDRHQIGMVKAIESFGKKPPRFISPLNMPEMLSRASTILWGEYAGIAACSARISRLRQGYRP